MNLLDFFNTTNSTDYINLIKFFTNRSTVRVNWVRIKSVNTNYVINILRLNLDNSTKNCIRVFSPFENQRQMKIK